MFPLANQGNHDLPEVLQDLYDDQLQDLFHQRANKLLDAAFAPSSLAALMHSNGQNDPRVSMEGESKHGESGKTKTLPDTAQGQLLTQWESLKDYAIHQRHLNASELYPVQVRGVLGWVRYEDFVSWFLVNNVMMQVDETQTSAALDDWAMKTQSFASLQPHVNAAMLKRVLSVDVSQVGTVLSDVSRESGRDTEVEDVTWSSRKMVYEDFIEALVRIWSQNERVVRITNPMFVNSAGETQPKDEEDGVAPQAGNDNASIGSQLDEEDGMAGLGGWLDVGSSVSSSVLSNQLLHRLLLWLLTQRQRLVSTTPGNGN